MEINSSKKNILVSLRTYRYNSISRKQIKNCYGMFISGTIGLLREKKMKGRWRN